MPSNGIRRMAARAPKLQSVGEVINRAPNSRVSQPMPTIKAATNRQPGSISRGQTAIPSIQTLVNGGGSK